MNSPAQTIPWSLLLEPLSLDKPCGDDLQFDEAYDYIRRARQAPGDLLPAGMWEREAKKPNFEDLTRRCMAFLAYDSKDLQIAAWLVECHALRLDLAGVVQALELFTELLVRYWADVHPRIEQGDLEMRLRPVNWLLRESLAWFDAAGRLAAKHGLDDLVSRPDWEKLMGQVNTMADFLSEEAPNHAPNFKDLRASLQARLGTQACRQVKGVDASEGFDNAEWRGPSARDKAYDQLREVSLFLARTEPHSPVPMVLDALVAWRTNSFEDLLARLPSQGGASVYDLIKFFRPDSPV
jgi:type VI secretion system protein ImpA